MENQIDDFFRDRLADAEVCPEPGLWNQIDKALTRRKEHRIRIYSTAAMLVFAVAALFILWNYPSQTNPNGALVTNSEAGAVSHGLSKSEVSEHPTEEAQSPARVITSNNYRHLKEQAIDLNKGQDVEQVSLHEPDGRNLINEIVIREETIQNYPLSDYAESEVIVFELVNSEDLLPETARQSKFLKSVKSLKRDGISLGTIQDFKNEIFNRLNRNRLRLDESETKFQTTEQ